MSGKSLDLKMIVLPRMLWQHEQVGCLYQPHPGLPWPWDRSATQASEPSEADDMNILVWLLAFCSTTKLNLNLASPTSHSSLLLFSRQAESNEQRDLRPGRWHLWSCLCGDTGGVAWRDLRNPSLLMNNACKKVAVCDTPSSLDSSICLSPDTTTLSKVMAWGQWRLVSPMISGEELATTKSLDTGSNKW